MEGKNYRIEAVRNGHPCAVSENVSIETIVDKLPLWLSRYDMVLIGDGNLGKMPQLDIE